MSAVFSAGQEVYDIRGRVGSYVGLGQRGHLVEPLYDGDDDDTAYFGDAETWPEVFATAPRERLAADLADLLTEIKEAHERLTSVQNEVHAVEQVRRDVLRRAKSEPQLEDLHLWLEGKVTHVVALDHYSVEIGTVEEVLLRHDRSLRLLSLYVDPKERNYSVQRAAYSDGSGNSFKVCHLATSEEHAKDLARKHINKMLSDPHRHDQESWARWAIKFDVPLTEAQRQLLANKDLEYATQSLQRARDGHKNAVEALKEAEERFAKTQEPPAT